MQGGQPLCQGLIDGSAQFEHRQSLIQTLNLAYPRLTVIYPNKKALVESFFYKPAKGDTAD